MPRMCETRVFERGRREICIPPESAEAEKLTYLRKAWQDGIDSGDAGELNFAVLKQEARARRA